MLWLNFRSILRQKARSDWPTRYKVNENYAHESEDIRDEEAVAEAFAHWPGQEASRTTIGRIADKVRNTLDAIKSVLRGFGFRTAADIFADIERGKIGARERMARPEETVVRFSRKGIKSRLELEAGSVRRLYQLVGVTARGEANLAEAGSQARLCPPVKWFFQYGAWARFRERFWASSAPHGRGS